MGGDHYQLLGISRDATQKEVAKAFRAKARVVHPDKQPPGISDAARQRATAEFQELSKAYEVMSDADKRAHYDFTLDSASFAAATSAPEAGAGEPRPRPAGGSSAPPGRGGGAGGGNGYTQSARFPDRTQAEWEQERRRYADGWNGVDASGAASKRNTTGPSRARQEHEEAERRRMQEYEQRQKMGSHWVKPPPRAPKEKWDGWVQSGKMANGAAAKKASDDDSDASSVLSFDIGIDLNSLDLHDLEPMDAHDDMGEGLGGGEVWRVKPAESPKSARNSPKKTDPGSEGKAGKGGKPCCSVQ